MNAANDAGKIVQGKKLNACLAIYAIIVQIGKSDFKKISIAR